MENPCQLSPDPRRLSRRHARRCASWPTTIRPWPLPKLGSFERASATFSASEEHNPQRQQCFRVGFEDPANEVLKAGIDQPANVRDRLARCPGEDKRLERRESVHSGDQPRREFRQLGSSHIIGVGEEEPRQRPLHMRLLRGCRRQRTPRQGGAWCAVHLRQPGAAHELLDGADRQTSAMYLEILACMADRLALQRTGFVGRRFSELCGLIPLLFGCRNGPRAGASSAVPCSRDCSVVAA
jgi:hypothetical protein